MAVTYNIRFFLFLDRIVPTQVFIPAESLEELNISRFSGCLLVTTKDFKDFFLFLFLAEVASSITTILFSNVIPFNLRNAFCTCSGTNANAKPLLYPISNSLVCLSYMFLWGIWLILDQIFNKDDQLWCQNWIFIFFFIQFFALFHFSFTRWLFLSLHFLYYFISCWKFLVGNFCWDLNLVFRTLSCI